MGLSSVLAQAQWGEALLKHILPLWPPRLPGATSRSQLWSEKPEFLLSYMFWQN